MHRLAPAFRARFLLVPALVLLAAATGACRAPTPAPSAVQQDAPRTPEFSTTLVSPVLQAAPEISPLVHPADCPGLQTVLAQIAGSPDPIALAQKLQIPVKDGKIQVVVTLNQPDAGFLQSFDAEPGGQAGMLVQAYVPPARLCDIATSGKVSVIRLPAQAVPQ
jgi:hypothetical protein